MPLIQRLQSKLNPNLVRLLAYLKPHKGKLLMSVFFMIGAGAGSSLIALLLGKLTDVGFYDQEEWIVLGAPAALIFIAFLHGGSMFMSNYLLGKTTQSVLVQLLTFEEPDTKTFPLLQAAYDALAADNGATIVLNAANEIAVEAFLEGRIGFTDIFSTVRGMLESILAPLPGSVDEIIELDRAVRAKTRERLAVR